MTPNHTKTEAVPAQAGGAHTPGCTKGPWIADPRQYWQAANPVTLVTHDGETIAECLGIQQLGNSRLIAAAPDLLDALQKAARYVGLMTMGYTADDIEWPNLEAELRAAIAKAKEGK